MQPATDALSFEQRHGLTRALVVNASDLLVEFDLLKKSMSRETRRALRHRRPQRSILRANVRRPARRRGGRCPHHTRRRTQSGRDDGGSDEPGPGKAGHHLPDCPAAAR